MKETMKELIHKFIHTSSAILISCIAVYSIVYAQQVCRSTMVTTCIPTSNKISDSYKINNSCKTSPSHHFNSQLIQNTRFYNFGAGDTCCEADHCDRYSQTTYISPSFRYDFYPLQKTASSFDAGNSAQTTFGPSNLPPSLKAVPIYILTQSIIC